MGGGGRDGRGGGSPGSRKEWNRSKVGGDLRENVDGGQKRVGDASIKSLRKSDDKESKKRKSSEISGGSADQEGKTGKRKWEGKQEKGKRRKFSDKKAESKQKSKSDKTRDPERTRSINDQISQHANRKELVEAKKLFQQAIDEDLANSHTYSIAINAYVRCGDTTGASKVMKQMISAGFAPCVVAYTTLINGKCKAGDILGALDVLRAMLSRKPPVLPNIRTINTLLRGCLLVGAASEADALFERMHEEWSLEPDLSTYEYVISLRCQALLLGEATKLFRMLQKKTKKDSEQAASAYLSQAVNSPIVNISLARAAALLKDWAKWKLYGKATRNAIQHMEKEIGERNEGDDDDENEGGGHRKIEGGKQGWRVRDKNRQQAASIFERHKCEEIRRELKSIEEFVTSVKALEESGSNSLSKGPLKSYSDFLLRLITFRDHDNEYTKWMRENQNQEHENADPKSDKVKSEAKNVGDPQKIVVKQITSGLRKSFGLDPILKEDIVATKGVSDPETEKEKLVEKFFPKFLGEYTTKIRKNFSPKGFLVFPQVFGNKLPVKLEICSGAGEWAIAQAKADQDAANWMALELRIDRVHQIFTRMIFHDVQNLAVLGGDATQILPCLISESSVHQIFVNHPEPPQQTGGEDSEGQHLLTVEFFRDMHRILAKDGTITIVTDNLWYAKLLARILGRVSEGSKATYDSIKLQNKNIRQNSSIEGFVIHEGSPGPECGHSVKASSYFDRLWQKGINRHATAHDRYFLYIKKKVKIVG